MPPHGEWVYFVTRGGPQRIPRPDDWRPGAVAPWADRSTRDRAILLGGLERFLGERTPGSQLTGAPAPRRTSAVMVPLYEHDGDLVVVLTRRTQRMRSHSGEVSFPGGAQDEGEDLWHTAVREAHEEVDLTPGLATPIGQLDRLTTVASRSEIVPFVAALGSQPRLSANPGEVDAILEVRLSELVLDEVYREELWTWPNGTTRPVYFFELYGDTVWGATASLLRQLLCIGMGIG